MLLIVLAKCHSNRLQWNTVVTGVPRPIVPALHLSTTFLKFTVLIAVSPCIKIYFKIAYKSHSYFHTITNSPIFLLFATTQARLLYQIRHILPNCRRLELCRSRGRIILHSKLFPVLVDVRPTMQFYTMMRKILSYVPEDGLPVKLASIVLLEPKR